MSDEKQPAPGGQTSGTSQRESGAPASTTPADDGLVSDGSSGSGTTPQTSTPLPDNPRETPVEPLTASSQEPQPTASAQNTAVAAQENATGDDAEADHRRRNEEFLRRLLEDAERAADRKPK